MATHSSILAWKIPWTEEPGGLQSMGLQRVGHDWAPLITYLSACGMRFEREHSIIPLCSKQVCAHSQSCNFLFLFQSLLPHSHFKFFRYRGQVLSFYKEQFLPNDTGFKKLFFFLCQNAATKELSSTQLWPSSVNGGAELPTLSSDPLFDHSKLLQDSWVERWLAGETMRLRLGLKPIAGGSHLVKTQFGTWTHVPRTWTQPKPTVFQLRSQT